MILGDVDRGQIVEAWGGGGGVHCVLGLSWPSGYNNEGNRCC